MEIIARTGREAYYPAIRLALAGAPRSPRGRATRDVGFTVIKLETPFDALPLDTGRMVKPAIAAAEALQLIGAVSLPNLMFRISPKFREYTEPYDDSFHGAYGNRIKDQMIDVANKLRRDEESRQAVVTLWDSHLDNLPGKRDYPCTVVLQFQIEDGKLCMNTVMRSNDVWLGLAYDMFQFTQLQMTLARSLSLAFGWYRHTTFSLHIYEDDIVKALEIQPPSMPRGQFQPMGVGAENECMSMIMRHAREMARGQKKGRSVSENWFVNMLDPYHRAEARRAARQTNVG